MVRSREEMLLPSGAHRLMKQWNDALNKPRRGGKRKRREKYLSLWHYLYLGNYIIYNPNWDIFESKGYY